MEMDKHTSLFFGLVMTFQAAAAQQMGRSKNPITDKIEKDLAQAQMTIDLLDMLEAKTRGNLTADETKLLKSVIQELKITYVDEAANDKKPSAETTPSKADSCDSV
ncbi:MAG TPA: DUF1844 domain-containing protein [Bacteroidota bacterium]|nr:DUF1844 domain-containing protein [Bacteroidota bacterium]